MTKLVAVSKGRHAEKVWRRPKGFQFAAKEPVTPIVLAEVVHVGSWMPIAFIEQEHRYIPIAIMSPMPNQNLFVGPDGQWLGGYIPSSLRTYPFRLIRPEGSERMALCVDEDSGLVTEPNGEGEEFFASDGKPSPSVTKLREFLAQVENNRIATDLAMSSLAEAAVIERWPLEVDVGGKKSAINGLYRINEKRLGGLDDETFLKLRKTAAISLAYAQLISRGQIARFDQLARLQQQLAQTPRIKAEDPLRFLPNDTIRFD
jgi:hypothetical protein